MLANCVIAIIATTSLSPLYSTASAFVVLPAPTSRGTSLFPKVHHRRIDDKGRPLHMVSSALKEENNEKEEHPNPVLQQLLLSTKVLHPRQISYKPHIKKVRFVSDIHTDHDNNWKWAETLRPDPSALLIVAGDVSHDEETIRQTLKVLLTKFGAVSYTPGNHDLWVVDQTAEKNAQEEQEQEEQGRIQDSVQKLVSLLRLCEEIGVETGILRIGETNQNGLWVAPILSWHHQSFDNEPDIDPNAWGRIPSVEKLVADYRRARWPTPLSQRDDSVARFMDDINDYILGDSEEASSSSPSSPSSPSSSSWMDSDDAPLLTFSHFVPRIELTPEKRYMTFPTLNKAVGSDFLERRLRRMGSSFHVFGHTHFGWDMEIDGIRYVQASLAYPREWEYRARSLSLGTMSEENDFQPVCVWEEDPTGQSNGFPNVVLGGYWSDRYYHVDRKPDIVDTLPPWNARRFKQLQNGKIEDYVRHQSSRFDKF